MASRSPSVLQRYVGYFATGPFFETSAPGKDITYVALWGSFRDLTRDHTSLAVLIVLSVLSSE